MVPNAGLFPTERRASSERGHDGAAQAEAFLEAARGADAYAFDLEEGEPGHTSFNGDASAQTIVRVTRAYVQRLHQLLPDKPLVAYARTFLQDRGIVWSELFQGMPYVVAWIKRYDNAFRGVSVRSWTAEHFIDYTEPEAIGCPAERVALVQYTDGQGNGPEPQTLRGLNREEEDISALLVPLSRITGDDTEEARPVGGGRMAEVMTRLAELEAFRDDLLAKLGSLQHPTKPAIPTGAASRIARSVKHTEAGGAGGPMPPG